MGEEVAASLARIFVGKLAERTTREDLETAFADYGHVVKVEKKETFAFVFYNESSHAQAAIAAMNGKELHGNEIVVETARGRMPSGAGSGAVSSTKGIKELRISCTGLDDRTSWQDLKDWARAAGNVTFANTFNKDGQLIGVIEFEVRVGGFHRRLTAHIPTTLFFVFQTVADVTNALNTLEGIPCHGVNLKLCKVCPGRATNGVPNPLVVPLFHSFYAFLTPISPPPPPHLPLTHTLFCVRSRGRMTYPGV